jgi:hypothetical protein
MTAQARSIAAVVFAMLLCAVVIYVWSPLTSQARNIGSYSDTITDSRPEAYANHTLSFRLGPAVNPGGYLEFEPGVGFSILEATSTWNERNVELLVNGVARNVVGTSSLADTVEIFGGSPGLIRYTLNPSLPGIPADADIVLKIGNNTSATFFGAFEFSTSTGTTTIPGDVSGIQNPNTPGTHKLSVRFTGSTQPAYADFVVAVVEPVGVGVDTRSDRPAFRFDGQPQGTIGGTTLSVEMSVRTDTRATCRFAYETGVPYGSMANEFTFSNLVFHSTIIGITPNTVYNISVRCIDDEGNINQDDYTFTFSVPGFPTGQANEEGSTDGDGTGTGDSGTGSGGGGGGSTGASEGEANTEGSQTGGGGSAGGSGGGGGGGSGGGPSGGFENDGPYRSGDAEVIISGYAYPNTTLTVLVDGAQVTTVRANASGAFTTTITAIARGTYTFGVFATDAANTRSSTFSTSFTVAGARTSSLSNINVPPSIKVDPDPVNPGQTLTVSGYALPNSTVTLENQRVGSAASKQTFTATTDASGRYSTSISTTGFSQATYQIRARAQQSGGLQLQTNFSNYTLYGVGQAADRPLSADLNRDGRVNLVDFSILLFWWNTDGGTSDPPADINQDNRVNLTDFSILLFNWTG